MTKKLITTYAAGFHKQFLLHSLPSLYKYSNIFNYDLIIPNQNQVYHMFRELQLMEPFDRPVAWHKIIILMYYLKYSDYDIVTWIDADCIINMFDEDINEAFQFTKHIQSFVVHQTPDSGFSRIPNTGVWSLKKDMLPYLEKMWNLLEFIEHPLWEQQANLHLMNWLINDNNNIYLSLNSLGLISFELPYKFNMHIKDYRFEENNLNGIIHVTGLYDNLLVSKDTQAADNNRLLSANTHVNELKNNRLNEIKRYTSITHNQIETWGRQNIAHTQSPQKNYHSWRNIDEMYKTINNNRQINNICFINISHFKYLRYILESYPLIQNITIIMHSCDNPYLYIDETGQILQSSYDQFKQNIHTICKNKDITIIDSIDQIPEHHIFDFIYIGKCIDSTYTVYSSLLEQALHRLKDNGHLCCDIFEITMSKALNTQKHYYKNIRQCIINLLNQHINEISIIGTIYTGIQTICLKKHKTNII